VEIRLFVHFGAALPRRHVKRADMHAMGFGALQQRDVVVRRHRHQVAEHRSALATIPGLFATALQRRSGAMPLIPGNRLVILPAVRDFQISIASKTGGFF
jgi:hypothetical protein